MEYAPYIFLAVLAIAIAIWIAYRLCLYFFKKTLFLAYIIVGFILLMIVSAYFYFKLSS